jgi:hypothetical protein
MRNLNETMPKTIFDILTDDYSGFLNILNIGLNLNADFYHVDFTKGETDSSMLLVLDKKNLTRNDAFSILIMRHLMISEEWLSFKDYNIDDMSRWIGLLRTKYINTEFVESINIHDDSDNFVFKRLFSNDIVSITKNVKSISTLEFIDWFNGQTKTQTKFMKSKFNGLEVEYYFENKNYYFMLNWYTTA